MAHTIEPNMPGTSHTPIVYEDESVRWKYKYLYKEEPMDESELNQLGKKGWELVSVVEHQGELHYYFKQTY